MIRYPEFPEAGEFYAADFNAGLLAAPSAIGDVVAAIGVIEYMENPWGFVRELVRLAKPGGYVVLVNPNQLSLLSKTTLLLKNHFNGFQADSHPIAAITAVLEQDLRRICEVCGLINIEIAYSNQGRIPFTNRHWSRQLGGRAFSDNLLCVGQVPVV
jgi:SAM-dependent methyltransferase